MIERQHWYVLQYQNAALVAGLTLNNKEIQLDSDAPFRATGVAVYCFSESGAALGPTGNVGMQLRFTLPDRTWVQKNLISAQQLNPLDIQAVNGAAGQTAPYYAYFSPFGQNILYPASSSIVIDIGELAGITDALVLVVFTGTKIFGDGAIWAPVHDLAKPSRPYIGYSTQFNAALLPILNLIFNVGPDADFAWQCSAQTSQAASTQATGELPGPG
jgi:hypothetical protein